MNADTTDRLLFTPGPLTTSRTVKEAMLRDLGSRDGEFIALVRSIRERLLGLAGVSQEAGYEAILMQGSGTFGIESVVSSVIPPDGKLLVLVNGAYGERIARIAEIHRIPVQALRFAEDAVPDPDEVRRILADDMAITHVAVVHCETTTGILNPIEEIGKVAREAGRVYLVDAMSSFGGIPIFLPECVADFLVSSSNKCIEGVPGFSFVLARRDALLATEGFARTLSLDLLAQWRGLEKDGQFRFTPPTHALLAFDQALRELDDEGGIETRAARYEQNHARLVEGMRALGFREYLPSERQSAIITTFHYPDDDKFVFEEFYGQLNGKGFVIYPGKLTEADCFRIGSIGHIGESDILILLATIRDTLNEMGVRL